MKIMIGVLAALGIALGVATWQLKNAWEETRVAEERVAQVVQERDQQREQAEALLSRFDALDATLVRLATANQANAEQLGRTLSAIRDIQPTEENSDEHENIACLDVSVPGQLDDSLR